MVLVPHTEIVLLNNVSFITRPVNFVIMHLSDYQKYGELDALPSKYIHTNQDR